MYQIGFDGGGTTTRAALIKRNGQEIEVLARGEAGSSNHYSVGMDGTRANCEKAMNVALEAAQLAREAVTGFGFGLAGACSAAEQADLRAALSPLCGSTPFVVEEDAPAAQAGAFAGGAGAILIAGTGANCFGVNEKRERGRADGLGPLLGDRGGGYRIGESALRAVCAALDGAGGSTSLVEPCLDKMGAQSIDALVQIVYQPDFKRDRVAALFPIVLREAENGDAVAQSILKEAGQELAATARAVMQKININNLAPVSGILENSPLMRGYLEDALRQHIPDLVLVTPQYDAAVGAALLLQ